MLVEEEFELYAETDGDLFPIVYLVLGFLKQIFKSSYFLLIHNETLKLLHF